MKKRKINSDDRRMPVGAEVVQGGGVHFRVWAPDRQSVKVFLEPPEHEPKAKPQIILLKAEKNGYFGGHLTQAKTGTLYRFILDKDTLSYPDPASRFQPDGPEGSSQVINWRNFHWTDHKWQGINLDDPLGQVIYEMHIGTFTKEGTWKAAIQELPELASLGVTVIELMPVAEFPGRFGWGYDSANLFAPTHLYGDPDDLRLFIDKAHAANLGVILDVVYNHVGPVGNFLRQFSQDYFSTSDSSEWGTSFNFNLEGVREYILANAEYWIEEFHLDGLRLDAVQEIKDNSPDHILAAIVRRVRQAARLRSVYISGENDPQDVKPLLPPEHGGYGMDALWNEDFYYSAMVAMTGRTESNASDYRGSAQEFVSTLKYGFLYQGQWNSWQKKPRGTPTLGLAPGRFINFFQNHDKVGNTVSGKRIHYLTSPSHYRVFTALLLLGPQTPMIFQGQEFAASSPFLYFADLPANVAGQITKGRARFLSQYRNLTTPEMQARLPNPGDPMTFANSKLDHQERLTHEEAYALHRDLLLLRRKDPVMQSVRRTGHVDGAVLNPDAFVVRFFGETKGHDRLLLFNLGSDFFLNPAPEPLLAPPENAKWTLLWNSENPLYGGFGMLPWPTKGNWTLVAESVVVLSPKLVQKSD